jgi:tetratricopeptide (TPR) repeat protein
MNWLKYLLVSLACSLFLLSATGRAQRNAHEVLGKECKIRTDVPQAEASEVALRVDEFCATVTGFYGGLGMEPRQANTVVLRLFANFDDFADFRARDSERASLRMYSSEPLNAIVAYYAPEDRFLTSKLLGLTSNMVMRRYCARPPEWVKRGFCSLFSGYEIEAGKVPRREIPLVELVVLQEALTRNEYVPLDALVKRSQETYEDRLPKGTRMHNLLPAAEGWGLVYYLLELAPDGEKAMFREFLKSINAKGAKAEKAVLGVQNWPEFEERWKKAILAIPANLDTAEKHLRVADGHLEVLNYSFAVPEYTAAYKLDKRIRGLKYKLGYALKRSGDYEGAEWWLNEAATEDPKSALPHYQLARLYFGIDAKMAKPPPAKPEKALEQAQIALDLGGQEQPLYLEFLARCQALNGDKKSALVTARKALAVADKDEKETYEKLLKEIQKGN